MTGKPAGGFVREFATAALDPDTHGAAGKGTLLPPLPRQRRRRMLLLGVLLVVTGALVAGYVYTGVGDRQAVVVLVRDVPVGAQISAADVATTRVAADSAVQVIPGRQLRQVLGRLAAVDLHRGTLLAPSQLTNALSPRPGQQVVSAAVKLSQLPARGLAPGDQVLVIATPGQQGQDQATDSRSEPLGQDTAATVDMVSSPDADGYVRVDLVVDEKAGPAIARQASTGRLAFLVTSRGRPR